MFDNTEKTAGQPPAIAEDHLSMSRDELVAALEQTMMECDRWHAAADTYKAQLVEAGIEPKKTFLEQMEGIEGLVANSSSAWPINFFGSR